MKRKKNEELTPWAKYQQENRAKNKSRLRRSKTHIKAKKQLNSGFFHKKKNKQAIQERRVFLNQKVKVIIGSIILVFCLILGYFVAPVSRVQKFEVSGNKRVSTNKILKDVSIKKNDIILPTMFKEGKLQNKLLKKNADIQDVDVSVSLTGKATIRVKENAVMGYVVRNKIYYTVKQDGSVVKKSVNQPSGNYPVFRNFKKNSTLKVFLKKYAQIPNNVQNDVAEVDLSPTKEVKNRLHFFMNDGNQVYAIMSTFAKKMKYYPEISASMKKRGMIDLQVGAFSRPNGWKDGTEKTSESTQSTKTSNAYNQEQKAAIQSSSSSSSVSSSSPDSESIQDGIE